MATKFEYLSSVTGEGSATFGSSPLHFWIAQTFTPQIKHSITSVKLKLFKRGSPSTITISIRATSGGVPTGADLTSGTIDGDALGGSPGAWVEILLTRYILSADTKYAIVMRSLAPGAPDYVEARVGSPSQYANGAQCYDDNDGGATWTEDTNYDIMFEDWGNLAFGEATGVIAVVEERLHYVDAYGVERQMQGTVVV